MAWLMKKVLVTGATGFIGGYVVAALLEKGHQVIATSTNMETAKQKSWFSRVTYIPFDLKNLEENTNYFQYFQSPDSIIHLAWDGLPNYKSAIHIEVNLMRHYRFLKNLVINGANDITVTGTCFEYGMQQGCLHELQPTLPDNPYGLAKDTLRKFLEMLGNENSYTLKWVRLFYMYGKGQNQKSLFSQLDNAIENGDGQFNMSGGAQIRDFLPVEAVADHIVSIALQKEVRGIINCASGNPISVKELVEQYLAEKKANLTLNLGYYPYPDYEPMYFWGNNEKLKMVKKST